LNAGTGNDTINVVSTHANVRLGTSVNGGLGDDTITVGATNNGLANIAGPGTANGDVGDGLLELEDSPAAEGKTYNLTATTAERVGRPVITYDFINRLTLNAGTGNDTINVRGTSGLTSVNTINGRAGDDVFNVGSTNDATSTLDNIAGPVAVNGWDGNDT